MLQLSYLHLLKIYTIPPANNPTKDLKRLDILISCSQFTISLQEDVNKTHVAAQTIKKLEFFLPHSCILSHSDQFHFTSMLFQG